MIICKCGGRVEVSELEKEGEAYIPIYLTSPRILPPL